MNRRLAVVFVLVLCGLAAPCGAAFSGLIVFGDSLSDVGNVWDQTFHLAPQSPPYYQGRYSNGPLWAEELALELSLPNPTPSRLGGRDYAYAGTKTGSGSTFIFPFSFPNIGTQINTFLNGNTPSPDQLFVIWGGGNDFIDGQTNPSVPVSNISNHVTTLANAGARQFFVPNLPPLGQVPRFRGTANEATMDSRSMQFNAQLATTLDNLELSLNVQIWQLDVGGLFAQLLSDPAAFGFTNVTNPALVGNTPVPNPDEYLFWDDIHPTRVGHRLLGEIAADLIVTHKWVSTQTGGSWSNPLNWDPQGVPASEWIAHVINDNIGLPQAVAVEQSSTVQQVLVRGDTNRMTLIVQSIATLNAQSIEVAEQGKLDLQGGNVVAAVNVSAGGTVGGTGMIDGNVTNGGRVAPGEPGTVLSINGDFTQETDATIVIDLAGRTSGLFDRLEIAGTATLAGSLAVRLADSFIALPGDSFQVMTFAVRSGDLAIENETGFAGLSFQKIFSSIDLTLSASAIGGDANLDGAVNLEDFNILAGNFGQMDRNWLTADFTGDGLVNLEDFNVLAGHFGQVVDGQEVMPGQWATLASVVPEPASALFTLLAAAVITLRYRQRRGFCQDSC